MFADATVGRVLYDAARMPVIVIGVAALKNTKTVARPSIYSIAPLASDRFRTAVVSELERAELNVNVVSPEYLSAAGFSVLAGRIFPDDPRNGSCRVAVVNREAADLWSGGNATGAAVIDEAGRRTQIIGVVQSPRLGRLQRSTEPAIYFPMEQDHQPRMTLLLQAPSASESTLVSIRSALEAVPGSGPQPMIVRSLETYLSQIGLASLRVASVILGACAVTALLLSVLGLYGTLSDTARRQRREMAVRIALGARPRDVIGWVLGQGARLAAAGTAAGIAGSLLISGLLSRIVMTSEAPPPWVWLAGPVTLAVMVAVASVLPARRSLMVDPVRALRQD